MICPSCAAPNRPDVAFCESCGASLTSHAAATPTCGSCGAARRPGIRFCETCGATLHSTTPIAPPPPAARCPACGASNRPEVVFCESCGYHLGEVKTAGPARRRSRAGAWAVAAIVTVIVGLGVGTWLASAPSRGGSEAVPTGSDERSIASDVADVLVTEQYPEYADAAQSVEKWESGTYLVRYRDPSPGPFPRELQVYVDVDADTFLVMESD